LFCLKYAQAITVARQEESRCTAIQHIWVIAQKVAERGSDLLQSCRVITVEQAILAEATQVGKTWMELPPLLTMLPLIGHQREPRPITWQNNGASCRCCRIISRKWSCSI
jgi:hypothetical protein